MAGLSNKARKEMERIAMEQMKQRADTKLIPYLKQNLRRDSGAMAENTNAEVVDEQGLKLRIVIGEGLDYPQWLEIRNGVFEDGTKAGAAFDEWLKMLVE